MDMSREERLAYLAARYAAPGDDTPTIECREELARAEEARAARHFGFAQPSFRTSIKLRFYGDGVLGHDLSGAVAGGVLTSFTGTVDAAGSQLHLPPGSTELFLSPAVAAGSTVLELFGRQLEVPERLDTEIDDTPVDAAIDRVFSVLRTANVNVAHPLQMPAIEGTLGKRLFALSRQLLDGDVDLGLSWTRPRGQANSVQLTRATARVLRDFLDIEDVDETERHEVGKVESISTSGTFGFTPGDSKKEITIIVEDFDEEPFRNLWAQIVEVVWTERTVSHPQRDKKVVTHHLVSIQRVDPPAPFERPSDN